jgi:hypothetical protein
MLDSYRYSSPHFLAPDHESSSSAPTVIGRLRPLAPTRYSLGFGGSVLQRAQPLSCGDVTDPPLRICSAGHCGRLSVPFESRDARPIWLEAWYGRNWSHGGS